MLWMLRPMPPAVASVRVWRSGAAELMGLTSLGDHGARLEGVVDPLDRVLLHRDEEARRQLRVRRAGVEELERQGSGISGSCSGRAREELTVGEACVK